MPLVVDTCILLDIALRDPDFGISSALFLEKFRSNGLIICPISMIEIAPQFDGHISTVRSFGEILGADVGAAWLEADTEAAGAGWHRYVLMKRLKKVIRRPVADILIGAFACRFDGLVTRNSRDFQPFFPDLNILSPPMEAG